MMDAPVHIFDAILIALAPTIAILVTYFLSKRDSKKAAKVVAVEVRHVATTVAETSSTAEVKLDDIHTLVNSRLTEALDRITDLETKLGLEPGEKIPPK